MSPSSKSLFVNNMNAYPNVNFTEQNRPETLKNSDSLYPKVPAFYQIPKAPKSVVSKSLSPFSSIESQSKVNIQTCDPNTSEAKKHIQITYEEDNEKEDPMIPFSAVNPK